MSIPAMPPKVADEILDYKIDMTAELAARLSGGGNDTLSAATFTVTAPADTMVVTASTFDNSTATVWLSGGVLGTTYEVYAVMHTAGGRTYHRSFKLAIKDR